jgi:hypothetical protein
VVSYDGLQRRKLGLIDLPTSILETWRAPLVEPLPQVYVGDGSEATNTDIFAGIRKKELAPRKVVNLQPKLASADIPYNVSSMRLSIKTYDSGQATEE